MDPERFKTIVADLPTLFETSTTWADTHMWAVPASLKAGDEAKYMAALKVLAFINDHNIDWARTGHMAVRNSVVNSEEYASLPHRAEYAGTAAIARDTPPSERYGAIQDVLGSAPDGFVAKMIAGDAPDWLEPVEQREAGGVQLWRVTPE